MENILFWLARAFSANKRHFCSFSELEICIKNEWVKLPRQIISKLIGSMYNITDEVLERVKLTTHY